MEFARLAPDLRSGPELHATGVALTMAEDRGEYDRFCREVLARFASSKDPQAMEHPAKIALLKPFDADSPEVTQAYEHVAEALRLRPEDGRYPLSMAMAEYRRGLHQEAADRLRAFEPDDRRNRRPRMVQ